MDEQSRFVRPDLADSKPYVPGLTIEEIKRTHKLDQVVKLSSNENPLGSSPQVEKVLQASAKYVFRYPRNHSPRLTASLAEELETAPEGLLFGNGSDELLDLVVRVRAVPGRDHVLCYENAFSVYASVARLCGVDYRAIPRDERLRPPLVALAEAADENTAVVFLTSPDNPTGYAHKAEDILVMAQVLPKDTLLVVDEAYVDFTWPIEDYTLLPMLEKLPNVILTRTFSKAWGLAGLRLGFAVMNPVLAEAIRRVRPPFSVNAAAEAAGLAAISDQDFYFSTLRTVIKCRDSMGKKLVELGCDVFESQANFIMFKPPKQAEVVFEGLLERGVIVRWLGSFGLPDHIRVSVGQEEENRFFLECLKGVLS